MGCRLGVLIFNVVVPALPRYAVIAALAAVTSVPVMVVAAMSALPPPVPPAPLMIFFGFVFPYILIVVMAYVGARIIYALGTEVSRARELGSYRLVERLASAAWVRCGRRITAFSRGRRPSS